MSIDALIARGRAAHERLLVDTCTITRVASSTFNATTGNYATSTSTIDTGACRLKGPTAGNAAPQEVEAADAEQVRTRQTLVLPHGAAASVDEGDQVAMTSGALNGLTFTVVGTVATTSMTADAVLVERVQ